MVCSVLFVRNMVNHQHKHVEHGFSAQSPTGSKLLNFLKKHENQSGIK